MANDPARIPVIIGVGQINDRPEDPREGLDPTALMAEALRHADADAGGGWLADCQSLGVIGQIGWPQINPVAQMVADALGMAPAHLEETTPHGDNPVRLLNQAANRIGAGEAVICAVTGAEALRTAGGLAKLKAAAQAPSEKSKKHDPMRNAAHRAKVGYAQSYGLVVPVDVYPLYENAFRAAQGQTLAEGQAESGAIWEGFSHVAAANEAAWIRQPKPAPEIVEAGPDNRPIAFPYTKFQVANSAVNQGAGFIVTSLAEAHKRGVPQSKIIHIGAGASAFEPDSILARNTYAASPGMEVSIRKAMELNGVTAKDLDHVELYSCFPCVPKMARRIVGWPLDKPMTVFGGLTFGGGPIGNYMSHSIACMVDKLREAGGMGLLFANGGYATHSHTIVLGSDPIAGVSFPQEFDFNAEADTARGEVPMLDKTYAGHAQIETYTVHYKRDGAPRMGTIVARTPEGARTLAMVPAADVAMIAMLTHGEVEPVGMDGVIVRDDEGMGVWQMP
ncbi:acetyl-CoA acetyltransferase [Parerythrobacter jejuensis]|uniref:Acetyl-CoA acetyltransferase n=1 Tax=Parerythrobacter jejuensis TaxID=795812 RepID=A0A845AQH1_9SPHN|nr:acetyl-CoA acetyltransferase [Parerythrobacter jejuensis]MXP31423.1 acetyl-CoA acetyltransferase [Parerythrobacter jejuensis]